MKQGSRLKIVSGLSSDISSSITIDNVPYTVYTEDHGAGTREVVSTVFQKGRIVFSRKHSYPHLPDAKERKEILSDFMAKQHKAAIQEFISQRSGSRKLRSDYFEELQRSLKKGRGILALNTIKKALADFPSDPFFLSYYGCLVAIVEKDPKEGIRICKDAIKRLDASVPFGSEFYYSAFFLNLGRAYLSAGNRDSAMKSFKKGLQNDPENPELLSELKNMGVRRRPAVRFLKRSNPINKYIGLLLGSASVNR